MTRQPCETPDGIAARIHAYIVNACSRGVEGPDALFADVMRQSKGTVNPNMVAEKIAALEGGWKR